MKCHICNRTIQQQDAKRPWKPDFKCSHCHDQRANLHYCNSCWWWECGPMPAANALPEKVKGKRVQDPLVSPCPLRGDEAEDGEKDKRDEHKLRFQEKCPLVASKWDGGLEGALDKALQAYDELYYEPGDLEDDELEAVEAQRRLVHAMCAALVSSHYRCRDTTVNIVHLWDTPVVASKHLEVCYGSMTTTDGKRFVPKAKAKVAKAALLAYEIIERILKDKLNVAQAHKQLRDLQAELTLSNGEIKETMELAIMAFHCCNVHREADDHWDWIDPVVGGTKVDKGKFKPGKASGFLSAKFKKDTFADTKLTTEAQQKLGNVYASLCIQGQVPGDQRFADQQVANLSGNVLTPVQARYLQTLPRYDHVGQQVGTHAPKCEKNIRKRVKNRIKAVLDAVVQIRTNKAQELTAFAQTLRDVGAYRAQDIPDPIGQPFALNAMVRLGQLKTTKDQEVKAYQTVGGWFSRAKKSKRRDYQTKKNEQQALANAQAEAFVINNMLQGYPSYRDLFVADSLFSAGVITNLVKDTNTDTIRADLDPLLDALITDIRGGTHWLEHSTKDGLFTALAGNPQNFAFRTETFSAQEQIDWSDVLNLCPKSNAGSTGGDFTGMRYDVTTVQTRTDGREKAWPWYIDWRVEKDRFIYDYHDIPPQELSNFCSFTHWRYDECPCPYPTYGHHLIVLDPNIINLNRCVFTLGDKGQPHRSALMMLQDIVCGVRTKYDTDGPGASDRFETLLRLLAHIQHPAPQLPDAAGMRTRWRTLVQNLNWTRFDANQKMPYMPDMLPVIEVHMFGSVLIEDAIGIYLGKTYYEGNTQKTSTVHQGIQQLKGRQVSPPDWELKVYECTERLDMLKKKLPAEHSVLGVMHHAPGDADLQ